VIDLKNGDKILIFGLVLLSLIFFFSFRLLSPKTDQLVASVYYQDQLIDTINLYGLEPNQVYTKEYTGENGLINVEYQNGMIRVEKETSPNNICSIQGWTSNQFKPIICLPNKFYIEIQGSKNENETDAITG